MLVLFVILWWLLVEEPRKLCCRSVAVCCVGVCVVVGVYLRAMSLGRSVSWNGSRWMF